MSKYLLIAQNLLMLEKLNKDALNAINYVLYSTDGDDSKLSPSDEYVISRTLDKIKRQYSDLLENVDMTLNEEVRQAKVHEILKEIAEYGDTRSSRTELPEV